MIRDMGSTDGRAVPFLSSIRTWLAGLPHDLESREQVLADIEALERRNAEKDEALRPFAEAYRGCHDESDDERHNIWEGAAAMHITIGDLRRASKALSHSSETGDD